MDESIAKLKPGAVRRAGGPLPRAGACRPAGRHLSCFIVAGDGRRLGCLLFQRASNRLRRRDDRIGRDGGRSDRRLERAVCNSRLPVLPRVRAENLASHALSRRGLGACRPQRGRPQQGQGAQGRASEGAAGRCESGPAPRAARAQEKSRRRRTIGTLLAALFVFRPAFSRRRRSCRVAPGELRDQCRLLGAPLPQEHPAAVRVDGAKINVPRELLGDGYSLPNPGARCPQGLCSCLHRPDDRMPIDFELSARLCERSLAATHPPRLSAGDVAACDRGCCPFELLWDHVRRNVDCANRLQRSGAAQFERFIESGESERVARALPGKDARRKWRRSHPGEPPPQPVGACADDGAAVQANFKNALATVARQLEAAVLGHARLAAEAVSNIVEGIASCTGKTRPGRSYPRVSKRPDDRFRNPNRKSGKAALPAAWRRGGRRSGAPS